MKNGNGFETEYKYTTTNGSIRSTVKNIMIRSKVFKFMSRADSLSKLYLKRQNSSFLFIRQFSVYTVHHATS